MLIALNVTSLITTIGPDPSKDSIKTIASENSNILTALKTKITSSIDPKISLINSATSLDLPTLINSQARMIRSEIQRNCIPRFETQGNECPVTAHYSHSNLFSKYHPDSWLNCTGVRSPVIDVGSFNFSITKSVTTQSTSPNGCVRIPTFEIGDTIFSYSDNIIKSGCKDWSMSAQNWVIGVINPNSNNDPEFDIVENWLLWDGINRKSCSTVTSSDSAWLICTVVTIPERQDYTTEGILDIWLGYMDVYGVRKSWLYKQSQINLDQNYCALYPSVGSGVVIDNTVYFLMYGGLWVDVNTPEYCTLDGCSPATQDTCTRAQHPGWFGKHRIVNMLLTFEDSTTRVPQLTVKLIPPSQYPIGAEGRLYYFPERDETYIYLRSSTWNSFLQFGKFDIKGSLNITWYPFSTFTRPGYVPCNAGNKCPADCLTGVYTDYYPLYLDDHLGISVMLTGGTLRRGPAIRFADTNNIFVSKLLTTNNQEGAYTTTTCFIFSFRPWCASVVELGPGTIGELEPVFLLYPIWSTCSIEAAKYYPDYNDYE